MQRLSIRHTAIVVAVAVAAASTAAAQETARGVIRCSNLIYGKNKTSVCYSPEFLRQIQQETNIATEPEFTAVRLESPEMYLYPFAVMTGEGKFALTEPQRDSMRTYLINGGFIVASAGCSSREWAASFRDEIAKVFPDTELKPIDVSHPIFHTVYDINALDLKKSVGSAHLEGLEVDGKIVLVFSSDGLNDTSHAGGNCCCCGGNEIRNAQQINVNLLAYTLTH